MAPKAIVVIGNSYDHLTWVVRQMRQENPLTTQHRVSTVTTVLLTSRDPKVMTLHNKPVKYFTKSRVNCSEVEFFIGIRIWFDLSLFIYFT